MASAEEKRKNQRFPLELPLEVNLPGAEASGATETKLRDISSSGVYFYLPQNLESGRKIEFYVRLQEPESSVPGIFLHCLGSVVRIDPQPDETEHGGQVGVAVQIDRYRFLRPDEKMPQPAEQPA